MKGLILAKKLEFLVHEFFKDPEPFKEHFNCDDSYSAHYDQRCNHNPLTTKVSFLENFSFLILCGEYCDQFASERWGCFGELEGDTYPDNNSDIFTFSIERNDELLVSELVSDYEEKFDTTNVMQYNEEYLFQLSTMYDEYTIQALEAMSYLKENMDISFRINLELFDLDEAVKVYGYK